MICGITSRFYRVFTVSSANLSLFVHFKNIELCRQSHDFSSNKASGNPIGPLRTSSPMWLEKLDKSSESQKHRNWCFYLLERLAVANGTENKFLKNYPSYKRGLLFQKNGLLFQKNIKFHLKNATTTNFVEKLRRKKNFFLKKCQILFADDMQ